jgi:hypothetical protein
MPELAVRHHVRGLSKAVHAEGFRGKGQHGYEGFNIFDRYELKTRNFSTGCKQCKEDKKVNSDRLSIHLTSEKGLREEKLFQFHVSVRRLRLLWIGFRRRATRRCFQHWNRPERHIVGSTPGTLHHGNGRIGTMHHSAQSIG